MCHSAISPRISLLQKRRVPTIAFDGEPNGWSRRLHDEAIDRRLTANSQL
jgi:hypothetical protein